MKLKKTKAVPSEKLRGSNVKMGILIWYFKFITSENKNKNKCIPKVA